MSILSRQEIVDKIMPVVKEYQIPNVWLFGSYVRNEATEKSDVDLVMNTSHIDDVSLFDMQDKIEQALGHSVDIIERKVLDLTGSPVRARFGKEVKKEMIRLI